MTVKNGQRNTVNLAIIHLDSSSGKFKIEPFLQIIIISILGQFSQVGMWSRSDSDTRVSLDTTQVQNKAPLLKSSEGPLIVKTRLVSNSITINHNIFTCKMLN